MKIADLRTLASEGSDEAKLILAFLNENELLTGGNSTIAQALYAEVASSERSALAEYALAQLILEREDEHSKEAFELYTRAAEKGLAAAQLQMARCYSRGVAVQVDKEKALHWAKIAAQNGSAEACFELGYSAVSRESYSEAIEWYKKGAKLGNQKAAYELAKMYEEGVGVLADSATALSYYKMAAEFNSFIAHKKLAFVYEAGELGVPPTPEQAAFHESESNRLFRQAKEEGAL